VNWQVALELDIATLFAVLGSIAVGISAVLIAVKIAREERRHQEQTWFRNIRRDTYLRFLNAITDVRVSMARPGRRPSKSSIVEIYSAIAALKLVAPESVVVQAGKVWDAAQALFDAPRKERRSRQDTLGDELDLLRTSMAIDFEAPAMRSTRGHSALTVGDSVQDASGVGAS
jgi:hypothetical protein